MQDGTKGVTYRGFSVEDGVRSSLIRAGSGYESKVRTRPGKGPERRRQEPAEDGHKERADWSADEAAGSRDSPRDAYGETAENGQGEVSPDSSGEGTADEGCSESPSGSFSESGRDGFGAGAGAWDCLWCSADGPGRSGAAEVCAKHDLLHSLAVQELAIARLIEAEAEKARVVVNQLTAPLRTDELIEFQRSVAQVLQTALETEKLLLQKLRLLLSKGARRPGSSRRKGDASGA